MCCAPILRVAEGKIIIIAIELPDSPGTSVTNAAEVLAVDACRRFRIDPCRLVWVERYGYPVPGDPAEPRGFDRVQFQVCMASDHVVIESPSWSPMAEGQWREIGLEPMVPVRY